MAHVDALSRIVAFAEAKKKNCNTNSYETLNSKICLPNLSEKTIINSKFSTVSFLEKAWISLGLPC